MPEDPAAPLRVALGPRSYDVAIGEGLLDRAGEILAPLLPRARAAAAAVVTDANLARTRHPDRLEAALARAGVAARRVVLPAGEATKSWALLERLVDDLLGHGIERGSVVVALGGGVIGDLAGFAAAVTLRGLDYVQVPTTLLSQVDSAVGGKTGINTRHGKNLVGAFHQPRAVLIDTSVLDDLPARELRAGYAEVVKYGFIRDAAFFAWLEGNGSAVLRGDGQARARAIRRSLEVKAEVVAADERETTGTRALLNFGHTFAHAYEALAGYDGGLLHGEAVAVGMVRAFDLSVRLGHCPVGDLERARDHLASLGLPVRIGEVSNRDFPVDGLLAAMGRDKKVEGSQPRFVLARRIGEAFAGAPVPEAELRATLGGCG